ncbi:MAG: SdrD B-like domain-containing protein [Patescibacteria group bacterium]
MKSQNTEPINNRIKSFLKHRLLTKRIFRRKRIGKLLRAFFTVLTILFTSGITNLLFTTPVHADPFYPDGDVGGCQFATVVGLQYNDIGGNGVNWDNGNVDGVNGNWIQNHHFTQVADITYPDAHRYPYIADRVAVPPNTRIEIGEWSYSYAGHGVNLDALNFFTSRVNPADGDITRLGAGGTYGTIYMNGFPARSGKYITSGYVGYFPDHVSAYGHVIYSFETIQPIQLQSFTASPIWNGSNLTVRYTAVLRNASAYNLCNIRFRDVMPTGAVYDQTFCINSGQNRTVTYDENWGTNYPNIIINDPATIWDNNWHEETQSETQPSIYDVGNPAIRPGVVQRDDLGSPSNWNANQPVWGQIERPPINVVLIPYWFNSGQVRLDLPPVLTVNKTVSDNDETNVETNDSRPNEEISYNITVGNTGGRATGVTVTDDYDQSLIQIIDSGGGNDNGNTITWNVGTLEHSETRTFTVRARVTSPLAHGTYQAPNTAIVDSDQTSPINDSTQTNITAEVRMTIDKTVSDSDETNSSSNHIQGAHPDNTERLTTYSIFIENSGDADAHSVSIHDNVSEVIRKGRIIDISDGGVLTTRIDPSGLLVGEIVWDIGNLPQTENRRVQFTVQFNTGIADNTQINNIAEVRTNEVPPVSDSTITTIHAPILEITKDDGIDTADPAQTIHWVINVRNIGTGNAYNTEVYDFVPERMTVSDISDDGAWDGETRRVVWSTTEPQYILNGSYQPDSRSIWGSSKTLTFNAVLDPVFPVGTTNLNNLAVTETSFYPPAQAEHNLPVEAYPDNDIEKFVINETAVEKGRDHSGKDVDHPEYGSDADSILNNSSDVYAIAGDSLKYTLIYRNTGNADSPDTSVIDHLPKYITDKDGNQFEVILSSEVFDVSDNIEVIETSTGYDIIWNIGDLKVSDEWKVKEFRVKINSDSTVTLSYDDAERLINNVSEIVSENELVETDTDNAIIKVNQPDAQIVKVSDKLEYQSDEEIVYSIHIENTGSAKAVGTVSDTLPEGLQFVSADYPEDKTIVDGQNISFEVELEAGQSIDIQIRAKFLVPVEDLDVFNNEVEYNYTDSNENERPQINDEVEIIVHAPILELIKEQTLPETVSPGEMIVYTIRYKNTGTGYSPETKITDSIPEHTKFVEFVNPDPLIPSEFNSEKNEVSWSIGQLEPQAEGTFSFKVVIEIPTESGTEVRNTAVIYTPVIDQIESEVITATVSSCCMGGFIWEDSNNNSKYDESEKGIADVRVNLKWGETDYLEGNEVEISTDQNGHYEYTGLPYNTLITVRVFKPEGYDNITTPDEFKLVLLPPKDNGEIEDYVKDGVRYLTASGCINFLNAGIYRDVVIAQTGESILRPVSLGLGLILIGTMTLILIIKSKRRKK